MVFERRRLACFRKRHVVLAALALALAFSALDVVRGQLSFSAEVAGTSEKISGAGDLSLGSRIFISHPGETAFIFKEILGQLVGDVVGWPSAGVFRDSFWNMWAVWLGFMMSRFIRIIIDAS